MTILCCPQVSWDFYTASKHGLATLEQQAAALTLLRPHFNKPQCVKCSDRTLAQLPDLPAGADGWSWAQWSALLQDPLQYKVPQLKEAAKQLKIPLTNVTKAVLVVSILQAFGLQQPSSVAPQLLRAVVLERCCACPWVGCEEVGHVWGLLEKIHSGQINQKWPGLGEVVSKGWRAPAAERRTALHRHAGASSKQELRQFKQEVLQLQEEISERERCQEENRRRLAIESAIAGGEWAFDP
jgi:hypothetical protein